MKTNKKYFLLLLLFTTQTIPIAFFGHAVPAIMRDKGISLQAIGWFQMALAPYGFSFLWAPIVDKYGKTYFRWVNISTLLYGLFMFPLIFFSFDNMMPLTILVALAVISMTTQDLAVDAFAIRSLSDGEKSIGNGMQSGGAYLGFVIGGGVLLMGYNAIGWSACILILCVLIVLPLFYTLKYSKHSAKDNSTASISLKDIFSYFKVKEFLGWIVILLVIKTPLEIVFQFLRPLLIDKGYTLEQVGFMFGIITMSFAMAGGFLAGLLLKKKSERIKLITAITGSVIAIGFALLLSECKALPYSVNLLFCAIIGFASGWKAMVVFNIAMTKVRAGKEATDYSFQSFLGSVLFMPMLPISGMLADRYGYTLLFSLMMLFSLIIFVMVILLSKAQVTETG